MFPRESYIAGAGLALTGLPSFACSSHLVGAHFGFESCQTFVILLTRFKNKKPLISEWSVIAGAGLALTGRPSFACSSHLVGAHFGFESCQTFVILFI